MAGVVIQRLEKSLLPFPDVVSWNGGNIRQESLELLQKVKHVAWNVLSLSAYLLILPLAMVYSLGARVITSFGSKSKVQTPDYESFDPTSLPEDVGFADSLFQTSGLGTKASATPLDGVCNWDKWLTPEHIEGTHEGEDYKRFFVDVLSNPQRFIEILKDMNVTAHRFSLERSVIEPEKGEYNEDAIKLYGQFIDLLIQNGIKPYITLHHFVNPEWFDEEGGFSNLENVENFKNYATEIVQRFPKVENWILFNEINVYGFQTAVRKVYPPGKGGFGTAAKMMRNMLLAHCQTYKALKEIKADLQIGSSHQWLKFEPLEGNPLEIAICSFMSRFVHYAVYDFFKTGNFCAEVPLQANVRLHIPKEEFQKNNGFCDFIGVQFYSYPRLKAGFNGGKEYPGYKIINLNFWKFGLTFGSTCPEGGEMMSFGPGVYPESMEDCLKEASALQKPIVISETGCDAKIQKWGEKEWKQDNEAQEEYFKKIFPIVERYSEHLKAFFTWTAIRGHLEWDRGDFPILGIVDIKKNANRQITKYKLSPAAKLLQEVFKKRILEQQVA